MKSNFLILAMIMMGLVSRAQDDVVYKTDGDSIVGCKIENVSVGNLVGYSVGSYKYQTEAVAIFLNGEYIDIRDPLIVKSLALIQAASASEKPSDFEYYEQTYLQARSVKNTGIALTILGVSSCVLGVMTYSKFTNDGVSLALYYGGGLIGDIGIALWIYGGVKSSNNLKAMNRCKKDVKLSFGRTSNGIGLRLALN